MSAPQPLRLRATAITDIGRVRQQNEDRFLCDPELGLFGVADGVGGLPKGAQAAQCVVDSLTSSISRSPITQLSDWTAHISETNDQVLRLGQLISSVLGIASTFTGGIIQGSELWLAHVGDSRCYLINADTVRCLTEDHSAENEAKKNPDQPPPDEKWREALVRVMGQPNAARPDLSAHPLHPGDHLLFVTDGISRVVEEAEFAALLLRQTAPTQRLSELIALTNERGGPDNATAVLVEILPSPDDSHE